MSTSDNFEKKAKQFAEDAKESAKEFAKEAEDFVKSDRNKRVIAGVLALFIGWTGIHKFILGYTTEGIIMLVTSAVLSVFTLGIGSSVVWAVGFIEGIIYLSKSDEDFYKTYQVGKRPWF